jgi:hypothetical protein
MPFYRQHVLMTQHPVPNMPAPSRPALIAALHAAPVFLAAEHDLPIPTEVTLTRHDLTPAQLYALAEQYGRAVQGQTDKPDAAGTWHWVELPISTRQAHGLDVKYTLWARVPGVTPMDVPARGAGVTFEDNRPASVEEDYR